MNALNEGKMRGNRLEQCSLLDRFFEVSGLDRTMCALGAPWFLCAMVGVLGIFWALRQFDAMSVQSATKVQVVAQPYAPKLPKPIDSGTDEIVAIELESTGSGAVADEPSKAGVERKQAKVDAGVDALREAIASRDHPGKAMQQKKTANQSSGDPTQIVVRLLDRAATLAGHSPAAVDHLIAVAERQAKFEGKPGMETSLQLAATEANEMDSDQERAAALTKITSAQARLGALDEARATSRLIDDSDLRDSALVTLSNVEAARDDIAAAKRTALSIERPETLADALVGIAQTQAQKSDSQGARSTASQIQSQPARCKALRSIAMVQASQADIEGAQLTVRSIPDPDVRDTSKADLVQRSLNMGDVCCAEFIANTIQSRKEKDRALESIASYRVRVGDFPGANQMTSRITDKQCKSRALTGIAIGEARRLDFHSARSTAARIPDPIAAERALAEIAKVQAAVDTDPRAARFTANLIKDGETEAAALRDIAGAFARNGQMSHALLTARGIPVLRYRSSAFLEIGRQHLRKGDEPAAQAMLDKARISAYAIQIPEEQSAQLRNIAMEEARIGDLNDALITAQNIEVPGVRDDALAKIAVSLASKGDVEGAWATAQAIGSSNKQSDALLAVAASIGAQAPVEAASLIVSHFPTPEEKIRFILSVADQKKLLR
ncbi:MAG: hypothetical protein R3F19_27070 [Verrucomicrobiales bacterium]